MEERGASVCRGNNTGRPTGPGMQMMMLGLWGYQIFENGGMISVILVLGTPTL